MPLIIFNLDSDPSLFDELTQALSATKGELEQRKFPDGESYLRVHTDCNHQDVIIFCNLYQPDLKILRLLFLTSTLKEMGAKQVGLITPYLPYMRQDKQFNRGECVSSRPFAKLLSASLDFLVTMDPHLHRYNSLDDIYTLRSRVVSAAPLIAHWIQQHIPAPLLIGPDMESEQWVSEVARLAGAPFQILEKIRHGDTLVEISPPKLAPYTNKTPVLIDDIISSGNTMLETINHLTLATMKRPVCIGVHGIFAEGAFSQLQQFADVITTQCIPHSSNDINIASALAEATFFLINKNTTHT
ncbi:ribose-phosphate pyrophosphokinase [Neptunomonas japonica]|uniref:ribose-phosphate diphosphokinase n=1 Tax=Neptunomonas japonica JAMM 1380 TaxID=1441457 RepID=A0A7R6PW17_9GAMM|nr:ribose-phosphate pyrophosphokinase [Neptunomonas japonica]BBB30643.1 ribose-phosphate pyrophosphokinase [Neptunomonas japonica JAMM 1380]